MRWFSLEQTGALEVITKLRLYAQTRRVVVEQRSLRVVNEQRRTAHNAGSACRIDFEMASSLFLLMNHFSTTCDVLS